MFTENISSSISRVSYPIRRRGQRQEKKRMSKKDLATNIPRRFTGDVSSGVRRVASDRSQWKSLVAQCFSSSGRI